MSKALATGALLALAACAGPNTHMEHTIRIVDYTDKDGQVVGSAETVNLDDSLVCGVETPTGTHISKRVCRFANETAFLRQRTQDMLRFTRGPSGNEYDRDGSGRSAYGQPR